MPAWRQCLLTLIACSVSSLALTGCVDDWLGHPGRDSQTPQAVQWALSAPAEQLLEETFVGLPDTLVDQAAYVMRPAKPSGWWSGMRHAAWADAVGVTDAAPGGWQPAYLSRLRALTDLPNRSIEVVVLAEPAHDTAWPKHWRAVGQAPVGDARWVRGLTLVGGEPLPSRVWVDITELEDPEPALDLARSHARAGRQVFLLGCLRADLSRWQACLNALRQTNEGGSLYALIDGFGRLDTAAAVLNSMLQQVDLFDRYRYASAYPYPAINTNIWLDELVWAGLIDRADVAPLRELYAHNPWLFDLALKRKLRLPGTQIALTPEVFGPASGP